jgi:NAD(P)-dependent dehydrogenase (short-subunit alcohol dehydrogenase family)
MELGLQNRSALVTGGASGIGRAIALALANEGARVIIADLDDEAGRITAREIGLQTRAIPCDVSDEAAIKTAVQDVVAHEGRLDILVNNAGIGGRPMALLDYDAADWDRLYAVNLRGVFLGIKHAARAMTEGGSIVNISSVAGLGGAARLGPYGATKAAVIQLTQTAALELASARIRVNVICPGWTETAMLDPFDRAKLVRQIPLGRVGQPEEIANLVVYLASDAAAFITGSVFRADGGIRS